MAPFFVEHTALRIDPPARVPSNTRLVGKEGGVWEIEQVILDPEDANDWSARFTIDLARSGKAGKPLLALRKLEGA
jgi:hypothetical protein